jgi:tRNA U34 5-methylaminomethyl-2-thiouridine-forming methyltransferase MnmC
MISKIKIIKTNDGSHTILCNEVNECFHSKHGSILEAEHVFIKKGLLSNSKKEQKILEIGYGTGLNTLLTLKNSKEKNMIIDYHTIDLFPLKFKYVIKLNFPEIIGEKRSIYLDIHNKAWEKKHKINNNFYLTKNKISLEKYNYQKNFDIIYFDAFSPEKQPELWTIDIFKKLYNLLNSNGFIVTYCAKGIVKRRLKSVGFKVISLEGPPGKREMIKACRIKSLKAI